VVSTISSPTAPVTLKSAVFEYRLNCNVLDILSL